MTNKCLTRIFILLNINDLTNKIYNNSKCVIHLIKSENYANINELVNKKYPDLWLMMKPGDLIEDLSQSGYRSQGRYYVDYQHNSSKFKIYNLDKKFDDYGSIPSHFTSIDNFPLGYFNDDNLMINNIYHPGLNRQSYWHTDNAIIFLNAEKLGLNKLNMDNIYTNIYKLDRSENIYYKYEIYYHFNITYNNEKYFFIYSDVAGMLHPNITEYILACNINSDSSDIAEIDSDDFDDQKFDYQKFDYQKIKSAIIDFFSKKKVILVDYILLNEKSNIHLCTKIHKLLRDYNMNYKNVLIYYM